ARPELSRLALDGRHADRAVGDDHEADPAVAPEHDLVARRVLDGLHLLFDRSQFRVRQTLQELGLFELDHAPDSKRWRISRSLCPSFRPGISGRACMPLASGCRRSSYSPG